MSSRPIEQPIMHPEALWDLAAIKGEKMECLWKDADVAKYARGLGHDFALHVGVAGFPTPFKTCPRGARRWFPMEIRAYFDEPTKINMPASDHVLYRHFDQAGRLLYVGVSLSALTRFKGHKHRSPWWPQVTRIELERFPTRAESFEAEAKAIRSERPAYNHHGT